MKNILLFGFFALILASCTDETKDPLLVDQIKKGSYIALRGQAFTNLNDFDNFYGGVDTFSIAKGATGETFEFDADYLSEDQTSLGSVELYAKLGSKGTRVKVATIPGSAFVAPSGSTTRRGKVSVSLADIATKTGTNLSTLVPSNGEDVYTYFQMECDLTLTNGSIMPGSSIVNSSLFESTLFYPAHSLWYVAKK